MNKGKNILSFPVNLPFFSLTIHKCLREMKSIKKVEHYNYNSKVIRGKVENAL